MSRVNKCGRDPRYLAAKTMLKKNRYDDGIAALTTLLEAYVKKFSDSSIEAARPHYEYANALLFKVENTQDFLGGAAGTATDDSKASSGGAAGAGAGAGAGKEAQANLMARAQEMVTAAQEAEEDVQIAFECFEVARVNVEKFLEDGCEE